MKWTKQELDLIEKYKDLIEAHDWDKLHDELYKEDGFVDNIKMATRISIGISKVIGLETYFKNMTYIPGFFLRGYSDCPERIVIPKNIKEIEPDSFLGCKNLKEIYFEKGSELVLIGDCAFSETGITKISLPEGLESLGGDVFSDCYNLKYIAIPGSIKEIDDYCLSGLDWNNLRVEYKGKLYTPDSFFLDFKKS